MQCSNAYCTTMYTVMVCAVYIVHEEYIYIYI